MNDVIPVLDLVLGDSANREVPARYYAATDCRAGICFSVGFGGDKSSYAYLARAWSAAGFSTLVIEHLGSNLEVLKEMNQQGREHRQRLLWERVQDPREFSARVEDFLVGLDFLERKLGEVPVFWAGHSYGSATILAAAGVSSHLCEVEGRSAQGLLCISPQPPGLLFSAPAYGAVDCPVLLLTGSRDGELPNGLEPEARRGAWELLGGPSYLAVLEGATHLAFAAQGLGIAKFLKPTARLTTRFWQALIGGEEMTEETAQQAVAPLGLEWVGRG